MLPTLYSPLLSPRSKMAARGALWVLTPTTTLPHQAKRRVEAGAGPAVMGVLPRAPLGPQRDVRAALQTWWTHWNNARWRSWLRTSQKVSDERNACAARCVIWSSPPCLWLCAALLSHSVVCALFFFLSVLFSLWLCLYKSLSPSVMNPHTFRWEASLCFFPAHRQTASAVWVYCPPCFAYLSQPDK